VRAPAWSPDGRRLAFVAHTRFPDPVENMHVWVVPFRGGAPRDLVPDCDLMCDNLLLSDTKEGRDNLAPQPVWSADGKRVFFLANWHGETDVWEVPADGGAPLPRTQGRHEITNLTQSRDGRRWAFLCTDPTSPGEVYVAEASEKPQRSGWIVPGAKVTRLTRLNEPFLGRKGLAMPEEFWVTCREGHRVHGWVLRAGAGRAGRAPEKGPAILMVHGGPYAMYGWSFFHEMQVLAARGYHVFYANIRGSCGYGNAFMRALVGKWGSPDFRDLVQVADWIETQPYVDKSRVAVSGGSYGGYLASWAIANTQRFKCAISMRGISNLVSLFGTSDLGWDLLYELDSPVWENVDRYWRISPLALVGSIRTPLLLMHPEDDLRCPVSQSEELFTALQVLRRDVEMVRFVGESHGLSRTGRPHNRLERLRRICDWFERKL
jgi:dipeptidyl aminopeptidase/acylaminoacyl peptidase